MPKFVNKHRQKRKYIKKTEVASSYPLSKTAYGFLPLLIMFIAFIATVVISVPLRDSLVHIRFTLRPPEISLSNPMASIQSLSNSLIQIGTAAWLAIETGSISLAVLTMKFWHFSQEVSTILDPRPGIILTENSLIYIGNVSWGLFGILEQTIASLSEYVLVAFSSFGLFILNILQNSILTLYHLIMTIGQTVIIFVSSTAKSISETAIIFGNAIVALFLILIHYLAVIIGAIFAWLNAVIQAIFLAITNFFTAVFHIIEIPFKILYAFWLQIKPYVDILGRHIQMTGGDLNNGFNSLSKLPSLLSSTN